MVADRMFRSAFVAAVFALGGPAAGVAQTAASAVAASPAASAGAAAAQRADLFDFWVGDWSVGWRNDDGTPGTGRNRITKILDGNVIQEEFEMLSGAPPPLLKGRSLSVLSQGVWRQAWADNQGGFFAFTAQVDGDRRIFVTAPRVGKDGGTLLQRMVFHSIAKRSLTWDWERSTDGGQTWALQWRLLYTR
jgi:hypothetical protein